jgi:phenylpyruvate tautomerase PptA (4-oxalocrotonate tautomerase family)
MPYLKILTNVSTSDDNIQALLIDSSEKLSKALNKSENYIMVSHESQPQMIFAGSPEPLAYLELKSIAMTDADTPFLSEMLMTLMQERLGVAPNRIYIEFSASPRGLWGFNGRTLAG